MYNGIGKFANEVDDNVPKTLVGPLSTLPALTTYLTRSRIFGFKLRLDGCPT